MAGIVGHRAGLDIAGQVRLDADATLAEKIHNGCVLRGADGVTDARGSELFDRGDDALCAGSFTGMDGHLPTGPAPLLEMLDEKLRRPVALVAGKIERGDLVFVVEQCAQLAPRADRTVGAGENTDEVGFDSGGCFAFARTLDDRGRDTRRIEIVRVGHESRTEAQFDVTDSLAMRILHVFPGHAAASVIIGQHGGHPFEFGEKFDKPGLRRGDDDMRAQFVQ